MTSEKKTPKKKAAKSSTSGKQASSESKVTKSTTTKKAAVKKSATKKAATGSTKRANAKEEEKALKKDLPTNKPSTTKENQKVENAQLTTESPDNQSEQNNLSSQTLIRGKFKPYTIKPDEEYMDPPQLEHFKLILNDWKAELMEEVDRTVHHMKDDSANLPDPADRATQEEEFNLELRTRDRERKLIKKIDKTLERIEHDDYGFCDGCGVEIGLRRLEARPTADLCIDCKTLDEIKERQFRT